MKELHGRELPLLSIALLTALLAACGGGGGSTPPPTGGPPPGSPPPGNPPPPATYTIGGSVTGLSGSGLVLEDNGGADLSVTASGTFTFSTALAAGSRYAVTVKTQPSSPAQTCTVTDGTGTVASANVTNVSVNCVKNVGNFAYAISLSGNVTAFTRNTSTGALSPIGALMGVGSLPFGFAIRPDESFLYVANTGDSTIAAFSIDPATGRLTPVSGSPFDNGAGSKPEALTFDPTGAFLYVANAGTGGIGVYSVNKSTGVLTALASVTGPSFPAAFTWHPNGKFLYVSDQPLSNPTAGAVWAYSINTSTGALTAVPGSPFSTPGTGAHSAAFGANGAYLYVATNNPDAAVPNALTGFRVNSTTGALTLLNGAPFAGITPKNTVATDQTGAYLYIANEADVEGYSISASTGQLTALSGFPITAGSAAYELTFDPANKFVYVGEDGGTSIPVLSFDVATGKLTPIAGSPFMNTYEPDLVGVL